MKSALMRCNAERHRSISAKKSVRNALLLGCWRLFSLSLSTSLVSASLVSASLVSATPPTKRAAEMEFDARVIQGQRAEGAVYLFQRAQRPLPPLLSFKRDYLGAITRPVLGVNTPASKALTPSSTQGAAFVVRPYAEVNAQEATQGSLSDISGGEGTQGTREQPKQPQKAQKAQKAEKNQRRSLKRALRKGSKTRQQAKRKRARKGRMGR